MRERFAAIFAETAGETVRLDFVLKEREPGSPLVSSRLWADPPEAAAAASKDVFEDVDYAIEELRELDDRVLVRVHGSAQGRGSGLRIVGTLGHLWTLRARKVVRFDVYGTWQEALDAVGLRE